MLIMPFPEIAPAIVPPWILYMPVLSTVPVILSAEEVNSPLLRTACSIFPVLLTLSVNVVVPEPEIANLFSSAESTNC